jgi:hypothetical protein
MVDSIVSVRMPSSLVQKLKLLSKENHFMDVSEELRSIIRIKAQEYKEKGNLAAQEPQKATPDFKTDNMVREELIKKLKEMIKELEHDK